MRFAAISVSWLLCLILSTCSAKVSHNHFHFASFCVLFLSLVQGIPENFEFCYHCYEGWVGMHRSHWHECEVFLSIWCEEGYFLALALFHKYLPVASIYIHGDKLLGLSYVIHCVITFSLTGIVKGLITPFSFL
jgi:hypothetical protein